MVQRGKTRKQYKPRTKRRAHMSKKTRRGGGWMDDLKKQASTAASTASASANKYKEQAASTANNYKQQVKSSPQYIDAVNSANNAANKVTQSPQYNKALESANNAVDSFKKSGNYDTMLGLANKANISANEAHAQIMQTSKVVQDHLADAHESASKFYEKAAVIGKKVMVSGQEFYDDKIAPKLKKADELREKATAIIKKAHEDAANMLKTANNLEVEALEESQLGEEEGTEMEPMQPM